MFYDFNPFPMQTVQTHHPLSRNSNSKSLRCIKRNTKNLNCLKKFPRRQEERDVLHALKEAKQYTNSYAISSIFYKFSEISLQNIKKSIQIQ